MMNDDYKLLVLTYDKLFEWEIIDKKYLLNKNSSLYL